MSLCRLSLSLLSPCPYPQGFGDPSAEYWLGNDVIHHVTISQEYSLHVLLQDGEGNQAYSHYDHFYINGEDKNYRYQNVTELCNLLLQSGEMVECIGLHIGGTVAGNVFMYVIKRERILFCKHNAFTCQCGKVMLSFFYG